MELKDEELELLSARTLADYDGRADDFWEGTRNHDVKQNIAALLSRLDEGTRRLILDFGCGPGRDLKAFTDLGHIAIGLEGAPRFAEMARRYSGCEVWQQNFLRLDLPNAYFDGIFANASLFHVPRQELPRVLRQLRETLKPRGVLFSSNPRGKNDEGWNGHRYGALHDLDGWRQYLTDAGFGEIEHYYRPAGAPPEEQRWLASLWRREG